MDIVRATTPEEAATNALGHIKLPAISAFDDTPRGREAGRAFAGVRDRLLAETNWSFSWASCKPAQMPDPAEGAAPFPYLYAMPADCIAVRGIPSLAEDSWGVVAALDDEGEEAVILGMTTNVAPVVHYTRRIENVRRWSALFLQIFEYQLAAAINPKLGGDNGLTDVCAQEAQRLLLPFKRRDAQQRARSSMPRGGSWLDARAVR